jgi:hypothetical protein
MKTNCGTLCAIVALLLAAAASGETVPKPRTQTYDEAYWFDPAHDLTLSIVLPRSEQHLKRQANASTLLPRPSLPRPTAALAFIRSTNQRI